MADEYNIETDTAAQLGRVYEEETENLEAQWRQVHLKMLFVLSLIAVSVELGIRFLISKGGLLHLSSKAYMVKYLLIPVVSYAIINLLINAVCSCSNFKEKTLNYFVSIGFAVFCLMMCFFHDYFVVVYATGLMAISLTTIYGDQVLTGVTTIIIIVSQLFIMLFSGWDPDVTRDETYMIDVSIIILIEMGDYLICNAIVGWEDRRRHAVIMRQYEIEDLRRVAIYDQLTKLRNRQGLRLYIDSRPVEPVYAMFDIDYFKSVNDRWGHDAGDNILRDLGQIMLSRENERVSAFRYGGDEFLLIFTDTEKAEIAGICEEIRKEFSCVLTDEMREKKISISYGIASDLNNASPSDAIKRADEELYRSKSKR